MLHKQRKEDGKASVVVGRVELQLRRDPVMAGGGGNGQCALTKTQTARLRGGGCRGGHGRAIDELAVAFLRRSSELGDGRAARQWRSGAARSGRQRKLKTDCEPVGQARGGGSSNGHSARLAAARGLRGQAAGDGWRHAAVVF